MLSVTKQAALFQDDCRTKTKNTCWYFLCAMYKGGIIAAAKRLY